MDKSPSTRLSASDDFHTWWTQSGEWVEPPNHRRKGWSGMVRAQIGDDVYYIKRQCNHLCRTLKHPLGWPTASREWHNINRLHHLGVLTPTPHYHGTRRTAEGLEAVLVTKELTGFTPLTEQTTLSDDQRHCLAEKTGQLLGILHRARLKHGCLYDKHIMICWENKTPRIALIDLEKMRHSPTRSIAAKQDLDQLKRHQIIWSPEEWVHLINTHYEIMHRGSR